MGRRLLLACLCATALAAPAHAAGPIQPGGYVETGPDDDIAGCTLNFVFDGTGAHAGRTYIGTAAHCVIHEDANGENEYVATEARDVDGDPFGTVTFYGDDDVTERDYAFIEVSPSRLADVEAGVAGSEQWPVGVTNNAETNRGDRIQISGYGTVFSFIAPTRERRQSVLTADTQEFWTGAGAWDFGDSGGPLVHVPTGKALGIESRVCIGFCTDEGPTVQGILQKAAAAGFTVSLRNAQ